MPKLCSVCRQHAAFRREVEEEVVSVHDVSVHECDKIVVHEIQVKVRQILEKFGGFSREELPEPISIRETLETLTQFQVSS